MTKPAIRILIAASGSGGHLLPALCIAKAIIRQQPDCIIEFLGSGRPLEEKLIGKAGFRLSTINVIGFKDKKGFGKIKSLAMLPRAFLQTWQYFSDFKPQLVIGVGGYVSLLPVLVAKLRGIPSWIHEAELRAGLANSIQGWYATRISTAFPNVRFPLRSKVVYTGHPIREEVIALTAEDRKASTPKHILILGGSQGADSLDKASEFLAPFFQKHNLEVRHQCRTVNLESVQTNYQKLNVEARVENFVDNMPEAYQWADIIISRSGASTVMEISVVNKPTIFVPYPFAQGQHQLHNAMLLVTAGKALLVEEGSEFAERLTTEVKKLLDFQYYNKLQQAEFQARSVSAAEQIAKGCLELIQQKAGK